jgi:hypothetical protein
VNARTGFDVDSDQVKDRHANCVTALRRSAAPRIASLSRRTRR